MAGTDSRFDATKFRDGIRFAMNMAFPNDTSQQITWQWETTRTFSRTDSGGFPLEWEQSQVVTEDTISDLIVLCAVKFQPATGQTRVGGTGLGIMDIASITATLLDTDYDALIEHGGRRPEKAVVDGNIYAVQFWAPPYALFEVNVYDVQLTAVDET